MTLACETLQCSHTNPPPTRLIGFWVPEVDRLQHHPRIGRTRNASTFALRLRREQRRQPSPKAKDRTTDV
ncbi:PAS/PAC sensor signal transduction histidine kinase [Anopheles sinensis]|uniref:PAS/PAC sensor signal transduction histidine kinase n=1 Tax=Anopheles sinensis TaxID=74873 RepID=A0A084W6Q8_ANOSI|nr:PAS/PAC sensor signal transduction histidine kinase [Anopheles sinensis]